MKRTFYSRIGTFYCTVIILALAAVWFPVFTHEFKLAAVIINALISIFMIALPFGIRYVIDGEMLKIYTFCFHSDVRIDNITRLERSRTWISSPAASLKRLAIYASGGNVFIVSPRHQEEFIAMLNGIAGKEITYIP